MVKEYYLHFKDIQDCLTAYYQRTGKKMLISDAMLTLHNENKSFPDPCYPDFSTWDNGDFNQLRALFEHFPINITSILTDPHRYSTYVSEDFIMPSSLNGIISLYIKQEKKKIHTHDFFEIPYVLSGTCILCMESEKRTMNVGEFCIIAPDTQHDIIPSDDSLTLFLSLRKSNFKTAFFNIIESDNILSSFFNNCLYNSSQNYLLFMTTPTPHILSIIKYILIESVNILPFSSEVATCYVSILFSEILRSYSKTFSYYPFSKTHKIPAILNYIKGNYRYINLARTASFFNYDASYLGKLIKQSTGMNFNDIVNQYKIEQAMHLLKYTALTINDIAGEVGFNSSDHFSRTFHKVTGTSPRLYRQQLQ